MPDCYPIPCIQDLTSRLACKTVFSKIDLVNGYYQILVHPADIPKTAIVTPFGMYELLKMPFGLSNAAQAFQCLMDTVCHGLYCVFMYMDDILVASVNEVQHRKDLELLFDHLQEHGLIVNVEK